MANAAALPAPVTPRTFRALAFWQKVLLRTLHEMAVDLSARQMSVLLAVYLQSPPHSIKSLSEALGISKPAACRAVDTLETLKLVKRQRDKDDKRNVLVQRTAKGAALLGEFAEIIVSVSKASQ